MNEFAMMVIICMTKENVKSVMYQAKDSLRFVVRVENQFVLTVKYNFQNAHFVERCFDILAGKTCSLFLNNNLKKWHLNIIFTHFHNWSIHL